MGFEPTSTEFGSDLSGHEFRYRYIIDIDIDIYRYRYIITIRKHPPYWGLRHSLPPFLKSALKLNGFGC